MELRHLRYLVGVVDAGGVTRAARQLHISEPTLSRQLRDLQAEFGVRLFDRVGRRLVLTPQGEELLRASRRLLGDVGALSERAHALAGTPSPLRIGAPPRLMESVLPAVLARYRRRHPAVEITLVEDGTERLVTLLEEGALHLAIGVLRTTAHVRGRLLYPFCLMALVPHSHRLASQRTLTMRDLATEPLLVFARGFQTRWFLDEACAAARVEPRIAMESHSPGSLIALAVAGYGIALAASVIRFDQRSLHAVPLVENGRPVGGWASVAWDARRDLPAHAEELVRTVAEYTATRYPGRAIRATRLVPRPLKEANRPAEVSGS